MGGGARAPVGEGPSGGGGLLVVGVGKDDAPGATPEFDGDDPATELSEEAIAAPLFSRATAACAESVGRESEAKRGGLDGVVARSRLKRGR